MIQAFLTASRDAGAPCGDRCATWSDGRTRVLAIIDGLGHGAPAALAADAAEKAIGMQPFEPLQDILRRTDRMLDGTRGAAVGILRVAASRMEYAAVGNTRMMRWREGRASRLPAQPGIVGDGLPSTIQLQTLDAAPGDWLVLTTDGIDEALHVECILPEWETAADGFCRHVMDGWRNVRDDAGVLVARL